MWAKFYTRGEFDSEAKANRLLEFIEGEGGPFVPVHYDFGEPVRKPYEGNRQEAIKLLVGAPKRESGAVFLKGAAPGSLAVIAWLKSRLAKWEFYLEDEYLSNPIRIAEYTNFMAEICNKFQIEYGWAGPEEDWRVKHWRVDYDHKGRRLGSTKVGADWEAGLPGVYWLTVFGPAIVRKIGEPTFSALSVWKSIRTVRGGTIIILRESPYEPVLAERLEQDRKVMQEIGSQYFFDIQDESKPLIALLDDEPQT